VSALRLEVLARPSGPFPRPGSDHAWMTARDRRRLENLRKRADVLAALRETMDARGVLEVETPLVVPSPGLDVHLDAIEVRASEPRFLVTSPEYQMKRLLSAGLGDVYQLGKCFRRGEVGPRHQPEFTMLEWYRSPGTLEQVLEDTEALVRAAAAAAFRTTFAGERGEISLEGRFERLSVADAFRRHAGCDVFDVLPDEERFFRIVVETIEPALGRERPVFLTRWPASMASLARLCDDDPRFAERAELFVDGLELSNGFGELTDPVEQRQRLERDQAQRRAMGLPIYPIDERFLAALEDGIPPSGGNALGVDRLVMLVCGTRDIDDVVAIPASRI
jgi:lysyl-tRNA synthetase class 2